MKKKEDKDTRYFIDLDLREQKIVGWDFDQKQALAKEKMVKPYYHRLFITKGQFNKLSRKQDAFLDNTK